MTTRVRALYDFSGEPATSELSILQLPILIYLIQWAKLQRYKIKNNFATGDQPKSDWIPFSDRLHIYRGVLGGFPDVLAVQRGAMQKRKECEKLTAEQKMGNAQLQEVNRRTDIMSYAVLAEMNHFRGERDKHLKETMKSLISSQIDFYQQIITRLQTAQRFFD